MSWDPGGSLEVSSTGVACWNSDGVGQRVAQLNRSELIQFLKEMYHTADIDLFIIEEYRIYPGVPHNWSKVLTIETIGILKGFALTNGIKVVEQPASILPVAQLWSGIKISKDKKHSHWKSAFNHGWYWLQDNKVIKSRLETLGDDWDK